jgi:membrane fusion protein (multidrug efflux system)
MVANVEVVRRTISEAMVVPQEALVRMESGYIVFVVETEGGVDLVRSQLVELGPTQRNRVVVLSGIEPGDRLIVVGQQSVAAGDRVNVVREG